MKYTIFPDQRAQTKTEHEGTMADVLALIQSAPSVAHKGLATFIKLATFGNRRSERNCLRIDENVLEVHGIEVDYDGEQVSPEDAAAVLKGAGLSFILHTSGSHTAEAPRWRALLPFAEPLTGAPPALKIKRAHWAGRVNALLGGILADESYRLSQAFYYSPVDGAPRAVLSHDGLPLDTCPNLPQSLPKGSQRAHSGTHDHERNIREGHDRQYSILALTTAWAAAGEDAETMRQRLLDWMGDSPPPLGSDPRSPQDFADYAIATALAKAPKPSSPGDFDSLDIPTVFPPPNGPSQFSPPPRGENRFSPNAGGEKDVPRAISLIPNDFQVNIPEHEMVVPVWVPSSYYTLIAGAMSSYKSTLALYFAILRATGADPLGLVPEGVPVPVGHVLVISYEDLEQDWKRRFRKVFDNIPGHQDLEPLAMQNIRFAEFARVRGMEIARRGPGGTVEVGKRAVEWIEEQIRAAPAGTLVILDPLSFAIGGSQNDEDIAKVVASELNRLASCAPSTAVMAIAHSNKLNAKEGTGEGYASAAYAATGSATYSNHARSNAALERVGTKECMKMFPQLTPKDWEEQTVVKVRHGRMSVGAASKHIYLHQRGGWLERVEPREEDPEDMAPEGDDAFARRVMPKVQALMADIAREQGSVGGLWALCEDERVRKVLGGRNKAVAAVKRLIHLGYVKEEGATRDRHLILTCKAIPDAEMPPLDENLGNEGGEV